MAWPVTACHSHAWPGAQLQSNHVAVKWLMRQGLMFLSAVVDVATSDRK